jgi:hypothetical protein
MAAGTRQIVAGSATPARRWAVVKLALGTLQMMSATGAATLLITTGINPCSLTVVVLTCVFTTLSVLLFGSRRIEP